MNIKIYFQDYKRNIIHYARGKHIARWIELVMDILYELIKRFERCFDVII